MKFTLSLLLTAFLLSPVLSADTTVTVKGDSYAKTLTDLGTTWSLTGTHHFKYKVFFSVFTAALYEEKDGEGSRLQFTYTRDLKAEDLRRTGMEHLKKTNDAETMETWAELTKEIQAAYVDVKDDDSYVITAIPGRGAWLHLNGKQLFFTENVEFGRWYMDIWLGKEPISSDLKNGLTGKN